MILSQKQHSQRLRRNSRPAPCLRRSMRLCQSAPLLLRRNMSLLWRQSNLSPRHQTRLCPRPHPRASWSLLAETHQSTCRWKMPPRRAASVVSSCSFCFSCNSEHAYFASNTSQLMACLNSDALSQSARWHRRQLVLDSFHESVCFAMTLGSVKRDLRIRHEARRHSRTSSNRN